VSRPARGDRPVPDRDRSRAKLAWYRVVQHHSTLVACCCGGIRATGRQHLPAKGGVLLVSNHLSFLDVFVLGLLLPRPLNYVARSTLFVGPLGPLIRSVGGFAIQRDGMGAEGLKETLRRLRAGGIVTLFPEGTRSPDGRLGPLKPGIAALAARAGVPVVPAGLAGTFESWPRGRSWPRPHPIRVHYGPPLWPADLAGLGIGAVTARIAEGMEAARAAAVDGLERDLGRRGGSDSHPPPPGEGRRSRGEGPVRAPDQDPHPAAARPPSPEGGG